MFWGPQFLRRCTEAPIHHPEVHPVSKAFHRHRRLAEGYPSERLL